MWSGPAPKTRRDIQRIVPFGVIWFLMAQVFLISDYAAVSGASGTSDTTIALTVPVYLFASLAVAIVGFLVGAVELLYLNRRLASLGLGAKLVAKTLFYSALLTVVILVLYPIAASMEMNTTLTDPRVWDRLGAFVVSPTSLGTAVQLAASLVASLFYSEVSEHMGASVLTNFLTGRYHSPKAERRVFLFSDMKSSTSIAEELGHARYFVLLRAYYDALAGAIVDNGGEVYQYIGDEIVVSWPEERGLQDAACIRCVMRMKEDLQRKAHWFEERFGVAPDFKAGLQLGDVTTGEIGALKREIVFTGDVLNQTARIQGLCNELGEDVLIGDDLRAQLGEAGPWTFQSVGKQVLRGKAEPVEVFRVVR